MIRYFSTTSHVWFCVSPVLIDQCSSDAVHPKSRWPNLWDISGHSSGFTYGLLEPDPRPMGLHLTEESSALQGLLCFQNTKTHRSWQIVSVYCTGKVCSDYVCFGTFLLWTSINYFFYVSCEISRNVSFAMFFFFLRLGKVHIQQGKRLQGSSVLKKGCRQDFHNIYLVVCAGATINSGHQQI